MRSLALFRVYFLVGLAVLAVPGSVSAQPPADGWVVWESTREEGRTELYIGRADGTEVKRLTRSGAHNISWAPDGRWIAYTDEVTGVHLIRPDGTEQTQLTPGMPVFWLHDNGGLVVRVGQTDHFLVDPETGEREPLASLNDFPDFATNSFLPNAMTHDNRYLLLGSHIYTNGYTGANGSFKTGFSAVAVDMLLKNKIYWVGNGCWPFTPPQGDLVFHICGSGAEGCQAYPDIMRLDLKDIATRSSYAPEVSNSDEEWGHEYNPRVSTDNNWIVYMTSTGCHEGFHCDYEVFIHRLGTGPKERIRVTESPTFDGYPDMYVGPLWSKSAEPRLLITPNRTTFHAAAGVTSKPRTVKIKNSGGGSLGGFQITAADPPVPWLAIETGPSSFTLSLREDALTRGRHQTVVSIAVDGIPGATTSFPVTLVADDSYPAALPDAGPADAGPPDAGPAVDGPSTEAQDSGCSCALGDRGGSPAGAGLLLMSLGLLILRRTARS
jgi:hypothetical protein